MSSKFKARFILVLGFLAILLAGFSFNVSIGALTLSVLALVVLKFVMDFFPGRNILDPFITQSVNCAEIAPDVVEHLEEKVSETFHIAKESVSKAWHHHHAEVESIAGELEQISGVRNF